MELGLFALSLGFPMLTAMVKPRKEKKVKVFMTGFGPFNGVARNPTSDLVALLPSLWQERPMLATLEAASILHVSAKGSVENINTLISLAARGRDESLDDEIVFVCMGVNGGGQKVHIEQKAYNSADFRVPDENGEQLKQKIVESHSADSVLASDLDLEWVVRDMTQRGLPVQLSSDPGRFVCNWIYYYMLTQRSRGFRSVFVHVPPADVLNVEHQAEVVLDFIETLACSLLRSPQE